MGRGAGQGCPTASRGSGASPGSRRRRRWWLRGSLQAAPAPGPGHESSAGRWTRRALSIFPCVAKRPHPKGGCGASAEPGTAAGEPLDAVRDRTKGTTREKPLQWGQKGQSQEEEELSISRMVIIWREVSGGFQVREVTLK